MKWWPKFSIVDLLWLTVAVALGFAITGTPEATSIGNPFNGLISDTRWPDGLQAIGSWLLLFALVQHGRRLMQMSTTVAHDPSGLRWRICVCFLLALALGLLSVLRLLFTRELISEPNHEDTFQVWNALWPNILLSIAVLVSLRMFLVIRLDRLSGTWWRRMVDLLMVGILLLFTIWMLTDRTTITMLVHVAISGIEAYHPSWLQRQGVFPNHVMEGYWSFWVSTIAAIFALVGVLLLAYDRHIGSARWKRRARVLFWVLVASLAVFAWWFTYREFPRINPDMASVPTPRLWSDTLAGAILLGGLAIYLALDCARERDTYLDCQVEVPMGGLLVAAGAVFVAVAEVWSLVESVRAVGSLADVFGGVGGPMYLLETFGEMLCWPETLLPLLVLASALALLRQSIRRANATKVIFPISPRRFGYFALAWAALLAVAVPAFWAFAMCYWLGPLVL
ncbi:hypothetical protein [Aeoliella sp.]|uniref:hypothetical protein n=1 Tax=Aeoliella sp. TaxID=2795800 RepID=UPI003CCC166B